MDDSLNQKLAKCFLENRIKAMRQLQIMQLYYLHSQRMREAQIVLTVREQVKKINHWR